MVKVIKGELIVSKFGGTSMGDFSSMKRSAEICFERGTSIAVVSATSGTTDKLIQTAKLASSGNMPECQKHIFDIKEKHSGLLEKAGNNLQTLTQLESYFTELDLLVQNLSLLKELTPRAHDHILSLGERMSSLIFRDVLAQMNSSKKVILLDARSVIKTDSHFILHRPLEFSILASPSLHGFQSNGRQRHCFCSCTHRHWNWFVD